MTPALSTVKRPVNMTLSDALVRRARALTPNLSETVESPLLAFVEQAEAKDARVKRQIEDYIAADDAFVRKYGSLADQFDTL